MANPLEQFLLLSSSAAPAIFSPIMPSSVSGNTTPRPGFRMATSGKMRPNKYVGRRPPDLHSPKITAPCSECGKKFWSWKALFGHMRCHPERNWRGINPPTVGLHPRPPLAAAPFGMIEPGSVMAGLRLGGGGSPEMSEDDHAVAASLMMLANSHGQRVNSFDHERENYYKCLSCRKVFSSHQALGGHRASHKNIKGCCFANNATGTATARVSGNSTLGRIKINEFAECEEGCSGASSSMATQLVLNSFATNHEACHDLDLSLRLSL